MVSQLSARLMMKTAPSHSGDDAPPPATAGSTTSVKPVPKQRKKRIPPYAMMPVGSVAGSSGYLADLDSIKTTPVLPKSIDLLSKSPKRHAALPLLASDNKRPKPSTEEVAYVASRAKEDVLKGGLPVPKVQAKRPRVFPPRSNVDMSAVSLLHSDAVDKFLGLFSSSVNYSDSPNDIIYWLEQTSASYTGDDSSDTLPVAFRNVVEQIKRQEQERQRLESEKEQSSSDSASTTSSFTVSDTGNESGGLGAGDFALNVVNACTSQGNGAVLLPAPSTNMISIGEALSISKHPRLLMLGSAPYTVVQANAAFHCLANCSDFLGKPVKEVIEDVSLFGIIKEVSDKHKQVVKEKHSISVQHVQKEATVYVSPVGPCDGELTHLSMELHCETEVGSSNKQPLKVMG